MSYVYTERYEPIRRTAYGSAVCPACGKTRAIQRTFQQTVNPFNRWPDGAVKTTAEVIAAVNAQAGNWVPTGLELYHKMCAPGETP